MRTKTHRLREASHKLIHHFAAKGRSLFFMPLGSADSGTLLGYFEDTHQIPADGGKWGHDKPDLLLSGPADPGTVEAGSFGVMAESELQSECLRVLGQ